MLLFSLAFADAIDPCSVWVSATVPETTREMPLDLAPVIFTQGGCGTEVRVEVLDEARVVQSSAEYRLDTRGAIEVPAPQWTEGDWTIELYDVQGDYLLERLTLFVGDAFSPTPPSLTVVDLLPRRVGDDLSVEVVLARPVEDGVLEVTLDDGSRSLAPAWEVTEAVFVGIGLEGDQCFQVRQRGPGGTWTDPVEACARVRLDDLSAIELLKGCGNGCSQSGAASLGGMLWMAMLGLARRR